MERTPLKSSTSGMISLLSIAIAACTNVPTTVCQRTFYEFPQAREETVEVRYQPSGFGKLAYHYKISLAPECAEKIDTPPYIDAFDAQMDCWMDFKTQVGGLRYEKTPSGTILRLDDLMQEFALSRICIEVRMKIEMNH